MAASAFPVISECRTAHRKEDHAAVGDSPVSTGTMIRRATFPSLSCPATHFGQLHRRCCHMPLRRVLHAEVVFVSSLIMTRSGSTRSRAEPMITSADVWPAGTETHFAPCSCKARSRKGYEAPPTQGNSAEGPNEFPCHTLPNSASAIVI